MNKKAAVFLFILLLPIFLSAQENLPKGTELLTNNYFDDSLNNWELYSLESSRADYEIDTTGVITGKNSVHIIVHKPYGDYPSGRIQLNQHNIPGGIVAGNSYSISFNLKANVDIEECFWTIYKEPDYNVYYDWEWIKYTKSNGIKSFSYTFIATGTDTAVYFAIDLASLKKDNVELWIDDIHLIKLIPEKENVFPPETVWQPIPPETLEKPGYLETVRDRKYGVDYTCISDPAVFGVPSGSNALRNHYPKDQAWNADMTKIILGGNYLVNADDYRLDKVLPYLYESRWSNVNPKIRYFCSGDKFKKINIETEKVTTLYTFPGYKVTIGPWEGNISADDKYVVITNESGGVAVAASLYDIELDSVVSSKSFTNNIDWISVPPSGEYIVVNDIDTDKIDVYDLNFNYLRTIGIGSQHGDFGVDSEGNEVFVQVIPVSMSRLSDGKFTRLIQASMGGHISGRGYNNPGWALVSNDINIGGTTGYYYATQLFEVKLDGSGTIRHFGYARSSCTTYENYPMGSVSPDGKKVIFNSDWKFGESTGGDAVAYISEYVARPTDIDESESNNMQMTFELEQNYPNPFNPKTIINYTLRTEGMTKLAVYDILGQEVKVLLNENMRLGSYSTPFDGSNLPSGIYFYKLESNNQVQIKKMLLLK